MSELTADQEQFCEAHESFYKALQCLTKYPTFLSARALENIKNDVARTLDQITQISGFQARHIPELFHLASEAGKTSLDEAVFYLREICDHPEDARSDEDKKLLLHSQFLLPLYLSNYPLQVKSSINDCKSEADILRQFTKHDKDVYLNRLREAIKLYKEYEKQKIDIEMRHKIRDLIEECEFKIDHFKKLLKNSRA